MAKKIYSFIETDEHSFRPPRMVGPDAVPPTYLGLIDGRHYVAVEGVVPEQSPAIRLVGPIELARDPTLRETLRTQAEPNQTVRRRRAQDSPDIGEQLDILLTEFAFRRDRGEALSPALEALINRWQAVKDAHPKPDLGLE